MHWRADLIQKRKEAKNVRPSLNNHHTDFSQSTVTPADRILSIQRSVGNQTVQRLIKTGAINKHSTEQVAQMQTKAGPSDYPNRIKKIATKGVQGSGGKLPYLEHVLASFGRFDVTNVQAHVGGTAGKASDAINAKAYATGNHVAFGGIPDLYTVAHEAAHVVQQRSGVQVHNGVGQIGDVYEQHADAVAERVVQGKSAEDLLEKYRGLKPIQRMVGIDVQRSITCWISHPFDSEARERCEGELQQLQVTNQPGFDDLDGVINNLTQAQIVIHNLPSRARTLILSARQTMISIAGWARENQSEVASQINDEVCQKLERIRDTALSTSALATPSSQTSVTVSGQLCDINIFLQDIGTQANNILRIRSSS